MVTGALIVRWRPPPTHPGPAMPEHEQNAPTIDTFALGPYETNCFIIRGAQGAGCWVADAGYDPGVMIQRLRELGLVPEAIVLTHCHADHIAGLFDFRQAFPGVPIWVHADEEHWLNDPELNLSAAMGTPVTGPTPDRLLNDADVVELCGQTWRVLHTPGHSPGGITLVHEPSSTAIVGDALFAGSIGRTDFPNADFETLAASIRARLYTLPDETRVLPGHGPETTIGREKRSNPFVRPT